MVKVGIIGATGFTGEELLNLLLKHPKVEISYLSAKLERELPLAEIFPKFRARLNLLCKNLDFREASASADLLFLALPHTVSFKVAPFFLEKEKIVIDLSADYRLKDSFLYKRFYNSYFSNHCMKTNVYTSLYNLC